MNLIAVTRMDIADLSSTRKKIQGRLYGSVLAVTLFASVSGGLLAQEVPVVQAVRTGEVIVLDGESRL